MRARVASVASGVLAAVVCVAAAAHATTYTVTSLADSGAGSLRAAIAQANAADAGSATIDLTGVAGAIDLATSLAPATPMSLVGPGASILTVQRSSTATQFPVFSPHAAIQVSGLTIAGGNQAGGAAAFFGPSYPLDLTDCVLSGNGTANNVEVIWTDVSLTLTRCTVTGNSAIQIVRQDTGTVTVTDSTFSSNVGTPFSVAGQLNMVRSTVSGNSSGASSLCGGVQLDGTAVITDSTFSGNTGTEAGDFWIAAAGASLTLLNVTAHGSSSPSLLNDHPGAVDLRNTILAGAGTNCALIGGNPITSQGHNLSTDATCDLTAAGDLPGVNPVLGPLANNGGPTQTLALLAGSPAINAGDNTAVPATDQRGLPRIVDGIVDLGAFEVQDVDAGAPPEAGAAEAGVPDAGAAPEAGVDAASADAAVADASEADGASGDASQSGGADAGPVDASSEVGTPDGAAPDAGSEMVDASAPDSGMEVADATAPDAAGPDATTSEEAGADGGGVGAGPLGNSGGCGCAAAGGAGQAGAGLALGLALVLGGVRRRRAGRRTER